MDKDDLIALGLRGRMQAPSQVSPPAAEVPTVFRGAVARLLTLLHDCIAVVDLPDGGVLLQRIEEWARIVAAAPSVEAVQPCIDACNDACRHVLGKLDQQRLDQKNEIASLVSLVHEALAIVSGDGQTFDQHLGHSMQRFEALVRIDDLSVLKTQLAREVGALREIAVERQKSWDSTCEKFTRRVETLERQLTMTKEEAVVDALTRIANRRGFDLACQEWLAKDQRQFVMAIIDVDHFKGINDAHGHTIGDRALVAVAQALKNSVRAGADVVARIGGDEFAVLIADLSLRQAESRLRMVASSLKTATLETPKNAPLKLTLSIGVAECSAGDTVGSLMERADAALYDAKHLGRNRVVSKDKPTLRELRKQ